MRSNLIFALKRKLFKCNLYHRHPGIISNNKLCTMSLKHFKGAPDRFDGVMVDSLTENCSTADLPNHLEESLKIWEETNRRGIWFKVAIQHSDWIPVLVKKGFIFHHAKTDFVMMRKWLPKEDDRVPPYSHTMIGVGAVVVNNSDILVVREKYGYQNWKLPGGYVEPGENLIDAAIREVYEETRISTKFHSILTMRQAHGGMFGCSDIYVVVSLIPTSLDIVKCDREINDCQWMKIEEYLNHPQIHDLNKFFVHTYLNYKTNSISIDCKHGIHQLLSKAYTVYFATQKDNVDH